LKIKNILWGLQDMSNNHLMIEFIGLPGSGKSTISKQVAEELRYSHIILDNFISNKLQKSYLYRVIWKVKFIVKEIVLHPVFYLKQINCILKTKQNTFEDFIKVTSNWIIIIGQWQKNKKMGNSIISDQGIIQAAWSIFFSAKEDICVEKYLDQIELPDMVFYIKVNREIMNLRLAKRITKQSRMGKKINFDNEGIYLKSIDIFNKIENYLNNCNVSLTVIDNNYSDSLFNNKEIIKHQIINSYNQK